MRRFVLFALLVACKPSTTAVPAPAPDAGMSAAANAGDSRALLAEVDRLKDQLKDKPKTFEVLAALGNLYYENGRYLEAIDSYRQALELAAPAEAEEAALVEKKVKPAAQLPPECRRAGPEYGLDQIFAAAKKLDAPKELKCLQSALDGAIAARARRANAMYLIGNADGALAEHQKVLAQSKDYPESLFFVGAILLEQSQGDKKKLEEGKKYWKRLLEVAPDSPRAPLVKETLPKAEEVFKPRPAGDQMAQQQMPPGHPPVGGVQPMAHSGELPPGHPDISGGQQPPMQGGQGTDPEMMKNVQEAVENTPRTPELEKGLDEQIARSDALLDQGKYQEARDTLVPVMPYRVNDAHTSANLGAAMRGLGRTDMAERTLMHALQLDPKQPRALLEMARLLAARGDKAGAAQNVQALEAADPKFAKAHAADLAKLR